MRYIPKSVGRTWAISLALALGVLGTTLPSNSFADGLQCAGQCTWSISVDNQEVGSGWYTVDPNTGNISLPAPYVLDLGDGSTVAVNAMNGNIDPILGFSVAASTAATGKTFAFNFSLPISLSGTIAASSSVSYSLTSLTAFGAQITPLFGRVVTAQEVDTTVGGIGVLNKGVDVGTAFGFLGGPQTQSSPVYNAGNFFTGDGRYDLMSVTVAFSLSANSNAALSGFVEQSTTLVPLPAALPLLLSGLGGLFGFRLSSRRRDMRLN
jgi:hypothetical protein